ncbi:MAG TPA: hypothetical protein VFR20_06395 [Burkholderiaceae bacterium]|nr:hypothetical protein [Burkholderiaceae bacterium]
MTRISIIVAAATTAALSGCAAMTAGQLVQAGYDAAKTSLTSAPGNQATALHVRTIMNSINVGQDTASIIASIGEPPMEKSGNPQGYTCYEYAAVYSPTEDAVIVSKDGKVVFYGDSTCRVEMRDDNFRAGGKYAGPPGGESSAGSGAGQGSAPDQVKGSVSNPAATSGAVSAPDTTPQQK